MMIHKIAGLIFRDKKVLMVKPNDEEYLLTPGGRVEGNETAEETLRRELMEEIKIKPTSMEFFGKFSGKTPDQRDIFLETFIVQTDQEPQPDSEIESLHWINSKINNSGFELTSFFENTVMRELIQRGFIE